MSHEEIHAIKMAAWAEALVAARANRGKVWSYSTGSDYAEIAILTLMQGGASGKLEG